MAARSPDKQQKWPCPTCEATTTHRIVSYLPSDWQYSSNIGMVGYQRRRKCNCCDHTLNTFEVEQNRLIAEFDQMKAMKTELEQLQAEVEELRVVEQDHQKLLKAIRTQRRAQEKVARLVDEAELPLSARQ